MEITWHTDWTGVTRPFQDEIRRKINRISRHISHSKDEAVYLHVGVKPQGNRPDYYVHLVLHLPHHTVKADKHGPDAVDAAEHAVKAVISELETLKGKTAEGRQRQSRQAREKMKNEGGF